MERPQFKDQLRTKWNQGKFVCVGLDADRRRLPKHLTSRLRNEGVLNFNLRTEATFEFVRDIVDATADIVGAYKPNIAFYEDEHRAELALSRIVDYIHGAYPDVPVIGDVKRADIGPTNAGYARAMFRRYGFDAITLNAQYFGRDTLTPFEEYQGKGLIVMAKTSNPGSAEVEDLPIDLNAALTAKNITQDEYTEMRALLSGRNPKLYEMVAFIAARRWNTSGNLGLVVGATYPEAFVPVRRLAGDLPLLIPGIGTQGGDLEKTLQFAPDSNGQGMIINSSSGVIFASSGADFAEAARSKALALHNQITQARAA